MLVEDRVDLLPFYLSSYSRWAGALSTAFASGAGTFGSSTAWNGSGTAVGVFFEIPFYYPVDQVFWYNGTTASGNIDIGYYDAHTLTKLWSLGLTAQSGTSQFQFTTPSPKIVIPPGAYLMALSSGSGASVIGGLTGRSVRTQYATGMWSMEIGGSPLPATFAPTTAPSNGLYPLFGFTRRAF